MALKIPAVFGSRGHFHGADDGDFYLFNDDFGAGGACATAQQEKHKKHEERAHLTAINGVARENRSVMYAKPVAIFPRERFLFFDFARKQSFRLRAGSQLPAPT